MNFTALSLLIGVPRYENYSIIITDWRAQLYEIYSIIATDWRAQVYEL